jgi:chemosensory pili system protein ChpC
LTVAQKEVYAVLVTLPNDTLLLPNAAVVEVLSVDRLKKAEGEGPDWLVGSVAHENQALPVIQFEALNGGARVEPTRRTRIAVIHGISGKLNAGRFGILCQGYPHLVTLNRAATRNTTHSDSDRGDLVLTRIRIANTAAAIPDFDVLEAAVAEAAPGGAGG